MVNNNNLHEAFAKFWQNTVTLVNSKAGGGPKDWNENDPNSPNYIQNRTHYAEYQENVTIIDTTLRFFEANRQVDIFNSEYGLPITSDIYYTVHIGDMVIENVQAWPSSYSNLVQLEFSYRGNIFSVYYYCNEHRYNISFSGYGSDFISSAQIKIIGPGVKYTPLDHSFLPSNPIQSTEGIEYYDNYVTNQSLPPVYCSQVSNTNQNRAAGYFSHAEGCRTDAFGDMAHSEGFGTAALGQAQHVSGKWNEIDPNNTYAHIVGNGESDGSRSNAYTLDWSGNGVYAGTLTATQVFGAVWNDYAEYRICKEEFKPGQCVCENGDDTLSISTDRMQPGGNIVSDTFGFSIGETPEAKCPVAVSGRVLAYPYEDWSLFVPGAAVCAGPNGTVSLMTRDEIKEYPDRIIGIVSSTPTYETWGQNKVKVNGRIWIKVR